METKELLKKFAQALRDQADYIGRSWSYYEGDLERALRNCRQETVNDIASALESILEDEE